MIEYGFNQIIGVDPSRILLRSAKAHLGSEFHPVVGVAENLPISDDSVAGIISCFSLRDVRDLDQSISEFSRVVQKKGRLEIVDIGKPNGPFLRRLIGLYVGISMPIIARVLIGRRAMSNPFRMIVPTFHRLPTNQQLRRLVESEFGRSSLKGFMFGGLIVLDAQRQSGSQQAGYRIRT